MQIDKDETWSIEEERKGKALNRWHDQTPVAKRAKKKTKLSSSSVSAAADARRNGGKEEDKEGGKDRRGTRERWPRQNTIATITSEQQHLRSVFTTPQSAVVWRNENRGKRMARRLLPLTRWDEPPPPAAANNHSLANC